MKNWLFVFGAALAIIGCGGSGGSGTTGGGDGGGDGGGTGDSTISVNLPGGPGAITVYFLTGQGRAPGDLSATIRRVFLQDSQGVVETILNPNRALALGQYTLQGIDLNVPMSSTQNSRVFGQFPLDVNKVRVEQPDGSLRSFPTTGQALTGETNLFPLDARAFLGRRAAIQIYLDDAMLSVVGNDVVFDQALFEERNLDPGTGAIQGFLSDMVGFDISGMANRPTLSNGAMATRVFFSGDAIALGAGPGSGSLELLTPDSDLPIEGNYAAPQNVPGAQIPFGTYSLVQPNPTDLTGTMKITALQGTWYDYSRVFNSIGAFEFIAFPSSQDDEFQDVIVIVRNTAGQITNCYFGFVDYARGDFAIFPLANVIEGTIDGELTGTISNLAGIGDTTIAANVRQGRFAFHAGQTLPAGFRQNGRFVVYRR